jgi:hypothetical protein
MIVTVDVERRAARGFRFFPLGAVQVGRGDCYERFELRAPDLLARTPAPG